MCLSRATTNPFTANQTFRRALLYGINRQAILETEVLGNNKIAGCQVISGPFPVGTRDNDPLAYAYDERIATAVVLSASGIDPQDAGTSRTAGDCQKRGEEIPSEIKLVIGYPGQSDRSSCLPGDQPVSAGGG